MPTSGTSVRSARKALKKKYRRKLAVNSALNRSLVSYQSNRTRPCYRWFKYKEGFSAALVEYMLDHLQLRHGTLLDPFAGTGAALLVAREAGFDATGIELMPIGVKVVEARMAADFVDRDRFAEHVEAFDAGKWKVKADDAFRFPHMMITEGAFSAETERQLNQFRTYLSTAEIDREVRSLLELACLSILESISYTRKDGQYLRWDRRAPRDRKGTRFDKGNIPTFREAMQRQLKVMLDDMGSFDPYSGDSSTRQGSVEVIEGSCLGVLPRRLDAFVDVVVTSPPYCNRYDYTRTYALELAYLGTGELQLKDMRQALLSCTVENRSKVESLKRQYADNGNPALIEQALEAFENQGALQEVLSLLDRYGRDGQLNNTNVPRMVRNYFLETAVVIFELARVVKPGGWAVMVNDNVQYGGEEVPVDLILSDLASKAGFETEYIWVLPRGKGNSSQQMGVHGRNELRKCVYVWQRK